MVLFQGILLTCILFFGIHQKAFTAQAEERSFSAQDDAYKKCIAALEQNSCYKAIKERYEKAYQGLLSLDLGYWDSKDFSKYCELKAKFQDEMDQANSELEALKFEKCCRDRRISK